MIIGFPHPKKKVPPTQLVTDSYSNSIRSAKELLEFEINFKKVTGDDSFFDMNCMKGLRQKVSRYASFFDIKCKKGLHQKVTRDGSFFDITFLEGRLHIPTLTINHDTQRIFRNLIAYEQIMEWRIYFMDYARFMDCLINYVDDVELLSQCGIIDNRLGTNEEVAHMFNKLNDFVYSDFNHHFHFYYGGICLKVNEYCKSRLWRVNLRNKYSRTPWDWVLASIVAGAILLLLAFLQTLFAVLSYAKQ